ncbi:MAG: alpha-amylase [Ruminococcus sp.]|nr:alpha-amylase [Ruminococcus sp.]
MAVSTPKSLRNQVIYQVFTRNFSETGSFGEVRSRLDDIKALGTDIIWFMPIHPIGKINRKGTLGSPYAASDFRAVNPEFGTMSDFKGLVETIHEKGMKCIIDVAYNHTAPDSVLRSEHPEWFYRRPDGNFGNRVGEWTDVNDLDYSHRELWDYQIETLKFWAEIVDGFRCDVAPLLPLAFWLKARAEVEKVRENCIWLSESIEPDFITYMRGRGMTALSDSEIYQAFDMAYEYDAYGALRAYLNGSGSLDAYAETLNRQEYTFPDNYVKLRFLENHDQPRAHFLIPDTEQLKCWTAFLFFQKGATLIYNGQEYGVAHNPSHFDRDPVRWDAPERVDLTHLIARLSSMKHDPLFTDCTYHVTAPNKDTLVALRTHEDQEMIGIFPFKGAGAPLHVDFPDGVYENLISGEAVEVCRGMISCNGKPIILRNF